MARQELPPGNADVENPLGGSVAALGLAPAEIQRRAVAGSVWTALHSLLSVPLAFVANAVVARALGPAAYGSLAFYLLTYTVAFQVTNLGVSDGVIQWGAGAYARGDVGTVQGLLRKSLGYHVMFQFPMLCAV